MVVVISALEYLVFCVDAVLYALFVSVEGCSLAEKYGTAATRRSKREILWVSLKTDMTASAHLFSLRFLPFTVACRIRSMRLVPTPAPAAWTNLNRTTPPLSN